MMDMLCGEQRVKYVQVAAAPDLIVPAADECLVLYLSRCWATGQGRCGSRHCAGESEDNGGDQSGRCDQANSSGHLRPPTSARCVCVRSAHRSEAIGTNARQTITDPATSV